MPENSTIFDKGDLVRHLPTGELVTVTYAKSRSFGPAWYIVEFANDVVDFVAEETELDFATAKRVTR